MSTVHLELNVATEGTNESDDGMSLYGHSDEHFVSDKHSVSHSFSIPFHTFSTLVSMLASCVPYLETKFALSVDQQPFYSFVTISHGAERLSMVYFRKKEISTYLSTYPKKQEVGFLIQS